MCTRNRGSASIWIKVTHSTARRRMSPRIRRQTHTATLIWLYTQRPMCNNQQINLCPLTLLVQTLIFMMPETPSPTNGVKVVDHMIYFSHLINKRAAQGKINKSAPLWIVCHFIRIVAFYPSLCRLNFPHEYTNETSVPYVPVRSMTLGILLLFWYVMSRSNESMVIERMARIDRLSDDYHDHLARRPCRRGTEND